MRAIILVSFYLKLYDDWWSFPYDSRFYIMIYDKMEEVVLQLICWLLPILLGSIIGYITAIMAQKTCCFYKNKK